MNPTRDAVFARWVIVFAVLLASLPARADSWLAGRVVSVTDGDTAVVETAAREVLRVRFYGVDAPETANRDWPAQPFAEEAKAFMQGLIAGKTVRVRLNGERTHKREVGEIFVGDTSASAALVKAGLGWWNKKFAPADRRLKQLQKSARARRVGLWQDASPIPPWRHRAHYRPRNR
jgi:endonuclease YncB( thermonuclease family)